MTKKLRLIKSSEPSEKVSEREIQETFEKQLDDFEPGLRYVASFVMTNVGQIDTLALDEDNKPTIIEFKGPEASSQDSLLQAVNYALFCKHNFSWLEKTIFTQKKDLLKEKLELDRDIRIVVIAPDFDERLKNAAEGIEQEVKLVSYKLFEEENEIWILPSIEVDTSITGSRGPEVFPPKTKEDHLRGKSEEIVTLYNKFERDVLKMENDIDVNYQPQDYIGFKNSKRSFLWVHPKLRWIRLDLAISDEEASSTDYTWQEGWNGGYIHLTDKTYDEAMRLVRIAYDKANQQ